MKKYVLTSLAETDLTEIWDYIASDSLESADRVLAEIEKAMDRLGAIPGMGHFREDLADRRHRFFLVYSYLIVYRFGVSPIQVVRVLHAARDIQSIFGLFS